MGNACTSSSKKNTKDKEAASEINVTANKSNTYNIAIDVVPDDQIPKDLIQRALKKVDTTDVDENLEMSPLNQVNFFLKKNILFLD